MSAYNTLLGLFLAFSFVGFALFVHRRNIEPIRSRGITLSLMSTVAGAAFYTAQSLKLSDPDKYPCGLLIFVSAINICFFATPYFLRCIAAYFKFMWNTEKLQKQTAFFHKHRWILKWYTGAIVLLVLFIIHMSVQIIVTLRQPLKFPVGIMVSDPTCDTDPQALAQSVLIIFYFIAALLLVIALKVKQIEDAFYIKIELVLMFVWVVPVYIIFFIVKQAKPTNFDATWIQMLAYFFTILVSIYFPLIMSFVDSDYTDIKRASFGDLLLLNGETDDEYTARLEKQLDAEDAREQSALMEGLIHIDEDDLNNANFPVLNNNNNNDTTEDVELSPIQQQEQPQGEAGEIIVTIDAEPSPNTNTSASNTNVSPSNTNTDDKSNNNNNNNNNTNNNSTPESTTPAPAPAPATTLHSTPSANNLAVLGAAQHAINKTMTKSPSKSTVNNAPFRSSPLAAGANNNNNNSSASAGAGAVAGTSTNNLPGVAGVAGAVGRRPGDGDNVSISSSRLARLKGAVSSRRSSNASTVSTHESLEVILNNPIYFAAFKQFCVQSWCVENVMFHTDYYAYKAKGSAVTKQDADVLRKNYIQVGAPYEVNIPQSLQNATLKKIDSGDHLAQAFDLVYRAVRRTLNADVFPRFRKSAVYKAARKQVNMSFQPV